MWTDPDNSLLRQSRWLDKRNRRNDRGVHNLNCCIGSGNYIANTLPALQVQTRPKCNVYNSSFSKALSFIKRAFSREPEHKPALLTLHNLNYDHHQYNIQRLQQQYVDVYWNESFASPVTRQSASIPLNSFQENIRQIFWGLTNSVRTSPFNQIMLQQRHYAMTTSFESISKCEQLPKMSAISRSMEAAKQAGSIKETTNLLSNAMSTIISSTTDFLEDLMSCLPGSTAELFKTDVKQPTVSQSKETKIKMTPPPANNDEIACIDFFARPTYCYFVIDVCAPDLDSVDMWHNGSHVSTAPMTCNKKNMLSSSTCNGDNDANNNSCQLDSSTLSFKDGMSPLISDCSPDVNSDSSFWAERSGKRRERNISECSDDFICFMDENDEEDEIDTDEDDCDGEGDEDEDDDDDDDLDEEEDNVDEVDNVPCQRHGKSHVDFLRCFQNIQPFANNSNNNNKNKNNSLAKRPRDKHNADNDGDAIMPGATLSTSSGCENNKHNTNEKLEPNRESSTSKRVRFDPKPTIHTMHAWDYAYRKARKGNWEDYARDRARFQQRIQRTAAYLNPILTPQHRSNVYNSRFTNTLNA